MKFKTFNPLVCFKSTTSDQYYIIVDGIWHAVDRYYTRDELNLMHEKISYINKEVKIILSESFEVSGSKGNFYDVTVTNGVWHCTCPAHSFRKHSDCKHITQIKSQINRQIITNSK